jgi:Flp pilus assembly protein CpaB
VADVTSMTERSSGPAHGLHDPDASPRRIRPPRRLPGGRAVVGALLVTAAAVATFAAYLDAAAPPTSRYVVATATIEPGTRLDSLDEVGERFGTVALELSSEVAARAIPASSVDALVGRVVVTPLEPGDLLSRTQLVDDGGIDGVQTLSFALPRTAAVGGELRPGERIDVLATFGSGDSAYTAYIVRGIPLLRVAASDGGPLGESPDLTLTVAVSALREVQALGHAVNTAEVFVTRSTATPEVDDPAPGAFRATPEDVGPRPDPAMAEGTGSRPEPATPLPGAVPDGGDG